MEIHVNEPNQASVSDIIQSRHDNDNAIICTPVQTTMESYIEHSYHERTILSPETDLDPSIELTFEAKGLHFCNLNIQHIVPKSTNYAILWHMNIVLISLVCARPF